MKHIFAAAVALSMLAAPAAMADQRPRNQPPMGQGSPYQGNQNQGYQNHGPQGQNQNRPAPKPQYSYNGRNYDAVHGPKWNAPKGYDAHRNWKRGQKLPYAYRDRGYVVDYRAYRLSQPPRGYQWIRVNNNVYLVQQSNGLIAQIVLNMFY
ncbi:MAG: RcnB family protein [Parvibaculum sp.]|uniref:RcnB family protein n=1 Tax=Parvibaculum sp. TaxID=2024848 RepID=UPI00283B74F9|nr:RcnB family protein [Parvibaculum sp.]MDR3500745.1 RcnB family protein [Parvibaculum sp.]